MKDIKKIHPVWLITLAVSVFAGSYVFAQVPFNFSLSDGGAKSVVQGNSVTNTITTTLTAGTPAPVSFSVSGLPPESTAIISPSSCTPSSSGARTCSPTPIVTISTDASTPPGVYPITITGATNVPITPDFPNEDTAVSGYCNRIMTSFYGKITIINSSSDDVRFVRTSYTTPALPNVTGSSPSSFVVPANSTLRKDGFGYISYLDSSCSIEVPGNNVVDGSATYEVEKLNGTIIVQGVTYSWTYSQ